jgi:hypothetical protein
MASSTPHVLDATALARLRGELEREIRGVDPVILERYPITWYIDQFDRHEREKGYGFLPSTVTSACADIERRQGVRAVELFHQLVMVTLIETFDQRKKRYRIAPSIETLIASAFQRILAALRTSEAAFYVFANDLFVKDLAICRLKLLPCGSELLDMWAGVPRSIVFRGGLAQLFRSGIFLAGRLRRRWPMYETHWDRRLIRQFTQPQYDACYKRIAELMELNPDVSGMFGSSWWFDPQVASVAPELVFLRRVPEAHGARVFCLGSDLATTKDAVAFSKKRRELYESGRFRPRRYMLVWPRADLLNWAAQASADRPAHG